MEEKLSEQSSESVCKEMQRCNDEDSKESPKDKNQDQKSGQKKKKKFKPFELSATKVKLTDVYNVAFEPDLTKKEDKKDDYFPPL